MFSMTNLQRRVAALPPEKRILLERRLSDMAAARGPADQITPRDPQQPTPLAFAQQREWAIGRLRGANNITGAMRLTGLLDVALLGRVLTEIVERHEALRTTIDVRGSEPVQIVHPVTTVPTPVIDLSSLAAAQQHEEVQQYCAAEVPLGFDADSPRRMRITVLKLEPTVHVALFTTDHAASDAWSLAILVQELVALYSIHSTSSGTLAPPPVQFGDFATWQHDRFDEERMAAELGFWRETLAGTSGHLPLPSDRPYPARPTFAGDMLGTRVPADLVAELRRFTERENVSLFTLLLATCSVLLHRYLDEDDIVVGSAISGRTRLETERLIGCFSNLLPLRMQIHGGQTLREVVAQARDTLTNAYAHQDVPFDRLVDDLGLSRAGSQTPLIQMMINVLTAPSSVLEIPGLAIAPEPMGIGLAAIDLTLTAIPRGDDGLSLQWQYMTELFDVETVALLADLFEKALRQVVTAPERTVGEVELAAPVQRAVQPDTGTTVVEMFQRRVALGRHSPAVVVDGVPISYERLNRDANRLARQLRAHGVDADVPVAILLPSSVELMVAVLAVLKAGGAFVPLDHTYPAERLGALLADSGAQVLVTQPELAAHFDEIVPPDCVTLLLDDAANVGAETGLDDENLPYVPAPSSAAYVIYTSGSTGAPKGVVIEHRSLAVFTHDVAERLGLGAGDRFLQFASPGFDVLIEELFPVWSAGGAVVVSKQGLLGGGADLIELADRERVSVIELPTAYWHEWVRELDRLERTLPPALRLVIIGGERVLPERLELWRRLDTPLMHVYGITETTVSSTFFRLDPVDNQRVWSNLPIGTPLPSVELHVLDSRLRPLPDGGIGELYIGGVSIARGYLGHVGLTAQRFVADPDPARPGTRLYRTGDLVRRRANNELEFVARADTQIKIRGFRVEPAEIESVLGRHRDVAESAVAVHEPTPGDRRLVAYVVLRDGAGPDSGELRRFLERELPAHLVPTAFVRLDALPLSPNGKLARDLLPAPDAERSDLAADYVAPLDGMQQKLAGIIAEVVGVEQVGVRDNFFEIGGDSILAIQVVAIAREEGIALEALDLFSNPNVEMLADVAVDVAATSIDAEQGNVTGDMPLSPAQRHFCARNEDLRRWSHSAVIELPGPADPDIVRQAVKHVLAHHDGLRQRVDLAVDRPRVHIAAPEGPVPFTVSHRAGDDEGARPSVLTELRTGLDLVTGPAVGVELIRGGDGHDQLVVVAHQLVADPTSMRILAADLRTAVEQCSAGAEVALPAKTTSWKAWTDRLAALADEPSVHKQRSYWAAVTAGPSGVLPSDLPAPPDADLVAHARTVTVDLGREETDHLRHSAPHALSCGVEDVLLTALSRTISGWTGAPRHVVAVHRDARTWPIDGFELSRTVGWFGVEHPVALICAPDSGPDATLREVKEALRAVPDGGIGWLLSGMDAESAPASLPLSFAWVGGQDDPVDELVLSGAEVEQHENPAGRRAHGLEVCAAIVEERLVVRWRYSAMRHEQRTVEELARRYLDQVRTLLELSRGDTTQALSPSDFPFARVDQSELNHLFGSIGSGRDHR